jgi:hypothetical protein
LACSVIAVNEQVNLGAWFIAVASFRMLVLLFGLRNVGQKGGISKAKKIIRFEMWVK